MKWIPFASFTASVKRGEDVLSITVMPGDDGRWFVVAVETRDGSSTQPLEQRLSDALDNHAHQALQPQPTPQLALGLAERYAAWWRSSRATHFACDCGEIQPEASP